MYNWTEDSLESKGHGYRNLFLFALGAISALVVFLIFAPQIDSISSESPWLINLMFIPSFGIGLLYGIRVTEGAMNPGEIRSPIKRSIVKIFLFFFIIGGLFSSVAFALHGGTMVPTSGILDDGLIEWGKDFVQANGGTTFLIISSITIMAAATRRIVKINGFLNNIFIFVGPFIFFSMIALSLTQSDPTDSQVYLYTFYQAGIVGGALFQMNRKTKNLNMWEDFNNGY